MLPEHLVRRQVRVHGALEVDVVALLDVVRIEAGAEGQPEDRDVWNTEGDFSKRPRNGKVFISFANPAKGRPKPFPPKDFILSFRFFTERVGFQRGMEKARRYGLTGEK